MGRGGDRQGGSIIGLLAMAILAPIAALLIQMAISRTREFAADDSGARVSGDPEGLASALGKLGRAAEDAPMEAAPQTSHLFIVNPLSGEALMKLFSTHPPLEERIARLRKAEAGGGSNRSKRFNRWASPSLRSTFLARIINSARRSRRNRSGAKAKQGCHEVGRTFSHEHTCEKVKQGAELE